MNREEQYKYYKRTFFEGEEVIYRYKHQLNRKSYTMIQKEGIFIREIISNVIEAGCRCDRTYKYLIQIKGNKNPSRIPKENVFHKLPFKEWLNKYRKQIKR